MSSVVMCGVASVFISRDPQWRVSAGHKTDSSNKALEAVRYSDFTTVKGLRVVKSPTHGYMILMINKHFLCQE